MIERKEKSQCFNKWIDFITSIYLYNGEGAYNDLGGKSQTKSYNDKTSITNNDHEKSNKDYDNYNYSKKKSNGKYNQKDYYRIEKYYEDYEETPDKRDSVEDYTENHTYIYIIIRTKLIQIMKKMRYLYMKITMTVIMAMKIMTNIIQLKTKL
jgi:hypothetical protein